MSLIDSLLAFDRVAFEFIHIDCANGFFDVVLPILRDKYTWIPLYLLVCMFAFKYYGQRGLLFIAGMGLTFALADQLSASLIKPLVGRPRPCHVGEAVNLLVNCGGGRSFISSHATNHFALAVFWIGSFSTPKNRSWLPAILLVWAALICLAQVYVGVHYPLDVLAGAGVGTAIGAGVFHLTRQINQRLSSQ